MIDNKKIDYQELQVFETVFNERSLTDAAARLHLTQPAISYILKKLRNIFDDPLFIRSQRGVKPTPRAELLIPSVREILGKIQELTLEPEFNPSAVKGVLSIAARDFAQVAIITPFLKIINKECPELSIAIHALPMKKSMQHMANGEVDLTIASLRYANPELYHRILQTEPYVCVVAGASKLAKKRTLSIDDLSQYGHVSALPLSLSLSDPVDDLLADVGIRRMVKIAAPGFALIPRLLQETEYIAILPKTLATSSQHDLKIFPVPVRIPDIRIALLWHQRVHTDRANKWFRQRIIQFCESRAA